jgi:hypothetical protein
VVDLSKTSLQGANILHNFYFQCKRVYVMLSNVFYKQMIAVFSQ